MTRNVRLADFCIAAQVAMSPFEWRLVTDWARRSGYRVTASDVVIGDPGVLAAEWRLAGCPGAAWRTT